MWAPWSRAFVSAFCYRLIIIVNDWDRSLHGGSAMLPKGLSLWIIMNRQATFIIAFIVLFTAEQRRPPGGTSRDSGIAGIESTQSESQCDWTLLWSGCAYANLGRRWHHQESRLGFWGGKYTYCHEMIQMSMAEKWFFVNFPSPSIKKKTIILVIAVLKVVLISCSYNYPAAAPSLSLTRWVPWPNVYWSWTAVSIS